MTGHSLTLSGLAASTAYHYRVKSRDPSGSEAVSGDQTFTTLMAEEVVTFADANLEAAIREAINKPEGDIYVSDLEGLTSLDASERNISDITGLEYCINLTTLRLDVNYQIADITPLVDNVGLSGGDEVNLRGNPLNADSLNVLIPQLEARGVTVLYDAP